MKNALWPERRAFLRKCWQLLFAVMAFTSANAQSDSAKYARINGYGFMYKRHGSDSVQLVPLYESPHTPYRAGAIKYRKSDSSFYKFTGTQWLKVQEGGAATNGIDTVYTQDDTVQVIVTPTETYYTIINSPYKLDSIHIYTASDPDPDTLYSYKQGDSTLVGYIPKGGAVAWGSITGTLSNQTDLQNALDAKLSAVSTDATLTGNGTAGNPLKVDSSVMATLHALRDSAENIRADFPAGGGGGISEVVAGFGLENVNDSTLQVDTTVISTRAWRYKGDDSVAAVLRQVIIDTAASIRNDFPAGGSGQDFSMYRSDPSYRWVVNPTLSHNNRSAYQLVKVSPSDPDLSITYGTDDTLIITTYDGDPRVAHPSVVYIDTSWNGYKYWMAFTPYPAEARENPSILASNDGITWEVPVGLTNPVEPGGTSNPYNSDVDLVFIASESKMYLFWRFDNSGLSQHYYRTSVDGINWINKTLLISSGAGASPAVVYKGNAWHYWDVDYTTNSASQDPFYLVYKTAPTLDGLNTATETRCSLTNTPSGKHLWHIDIVWDTIEDQMIGIFNYTDINPGGAPNNGGILRYATSTDYLTWDVRTENLPFQSSLYRSTFARTDSAELNGAAFELWYNPQWKIKHTYIYLSPRTSASYAYDTVTNVGAVYSLKYRIGSYKGGPVARVRRASDGAFRDVFPGADNTGLITADSNDLKDFESGSTLELDRLYNQKSNSGDYVKFVNRPAFVDSIWKPYTGWGWVHDGTDDYGDGYKQVTQRGVSFMGYMSDTTDSKFWSIDNGVAYAAVNLKNFTLLATGNITTPYIPEPGAWSGLINGASSSIRRNGSQAATGSLTNPGASAGNVIGAFWTGVTFTHFMDGRFTELVSYNGVPYTTGVQAIENTQLADYPQNADSTVHDTYTDANGTALGSHTAEAGGSYTTTDANWEIQSNQLARSAAGTGRPTAIIDAGNDNGAVEGTITRSGSGGAGLVFRWVDDDNMIYVRVFGTTLGVIKYLGGSVSTPQSTSISDPGSTYTIRVEKWESRIRVYVNGTLHITYTENSFVGNTNVGFFCPTTESASTFDNLEFKPFVTLW